MSIRSRLEALEAARNLGHPADKNSPLAALLDAFDVDRRLSAMEDRMASTEGALRILQGRITRRMKAETTLSNKITAIKALVDVKTRD